MKKALNDYTKKYLDFSNKYYCVLEMVESVRKESIPREKEKELDADLVGLKSNYKEFIGYLMDIVNNPLDVSSKLNSCSVAFVSYFEFVKQDIEEIRGH